jgi:restriction endonuclease Mrr
VVVDTAGLSPKATELANRLAEKIADLDDPRLDALLAELRDPVDNAGPRY